MFTPNRQIPEKKKQPTEEKNFRNLNYDAK